MLTPNLDKLASESLVFDATYCQAPTLVPEHKLRIEGVAQAKVEPGGAPHHIATFVAEKKGAPAMLRIWKYGDFGEGRFLASKAFYKELLASGLGQQGSNQFQELKVKKVNAGSPATVDFEYELLTGAGFVVQRNGVAAVTAVGGKSQALIAVTTSARYKKLEPALRTMTTSFRCFEKVAPASDDATSFDRESSTGVGACGSRLVNNFYVYKFFLLLFNTNTLKYFNII